MIQNLQKWFGKTETDKFFGSWKEFIEIHKEENESFDDFILRYDTIDSKLKSCNENISQRALACHLVYKLDVNEQQKQNILSSVKFENNPNVFEDIKGAIRLLKGSLVEGSKPNKIPETPKSTQPERKVDEEEENVFYGENAKKNYGRYNRKYSDRSQAKESSGK